ncbi:MAG: hypothetical protein ACR2NN_01155 [Bryobacteraceae bacterium]
MQPNPLRYRPLLYFLFLLALNAFIVRRLFVTEFTQHMNSNEGTFMSISRFILSDWPHLSWYPRWFNGVPFQNTYSPLLQFVDAGFAKLAHCSTALAFHAVTAFFYSLGPALLFLFAWKLSGLLETSLSAALLYSLFSPSAMFWLVYNDIFGWRHARRLHTLVHYGEGAHNVALSLLPLALLLFYLAITRRRLRWYIATGAFFGVVVLFNAFGATDLSLGAACLLLAFSRELRLRDMAALAATAACSYLWISPCLPPTLIQTIRVNSLSVAGDYHYTPLSRAVLLLVVAAWLCLWYATRRLKSRFDRFILLFAFIFTAIPTLSVWGNISIVPQPDRYHLEMEMGLCLAAIFLARHLVVRLNPNVRMAVLLIFAVFLTRQTITYSRYAQKLIQPIDITTTVEYRMAKWLDRNLPGLRAMVSDEGGTWFNVFTDNPQLSSGHDPFSPNWWVEAAVYAIYAGETHGHEASVAWLKAFGCHAITVPGPHSRQTYRPFRRPNKFAGALPVLWHDEDDTIYGVPQRGTSLAHVIPATAAIGHPPRNGVDLTGIGPFVAAMEDPRLPLAEMSWLRSDRAHISAPVQAGQVIAVQVTWDPGWKASANGHPAAITRDGIGLMTLHPDCSGPCEVDLTFEQGLERTMCWLASLLVIIGITAYSAYRAATVREPVARPLF